MRFYGGNAGKSPSGDFIAGIRLSTSASGGDGTTVSATVQPSLAAFAEGILVHSFTIPANLPHGTYFIHYDMDWQNHRAEVREHDNTTISGRTLVVNCG